MRASRTRDLEPLEVELNEARLRLEELEMRKSIRDALADEYRLKMPAIKWEIGKYEEGLKGEDNPTVRPCAPSPSTNLCWVSPSNVSISAP